MSSLQDGTLSDPSSKFIFSAEQQDTANLLERLLGKTVSDRYVDFCQLSSGAFDLRVVSPLAAHSLRELESILRQALGIPLQAVATPTEGEEARISATSNVLRDMGYSEEEIERAAEALRPRVSHKDEIRKIVTQLGLAEDGDIARAWIAVSTAHKKAHERPFNRALEVDDEFRKEWADPFHMVIRGVAVALQGRYTALMARVEELAAMPDRVHALVLFKKEIPGAMSLQWHFFRSIKGPSWLPELIKRGLIAEPPFAAEETKSQLMRQWPVGRYLVEMAKSGDAATRGLVVYALRPLAGSKHPDVRRDALEVVAALPPSEAARVADLVPQWLGDDDFIFGTHFAEEIVKRLVEAGEKTACLTAARGLYRLSGGDRRIMTSFTAHMYEHSIFKMTPLLTQALELDALKLFCDLLFEAAAITEKVSTEPPKDHTTFSSLPLPRTEADQHNIYGALTGAVLRCCEQLIKDGKDSGDAIIAILLKRRYRIYQRIALNALAIRPDIAPSEADALLLDPDLLLNSSLSQEYAGLAARRFPSMAAEKQNELMALVDSIPPKYIDSWRARFTEYHKRTPNEADEADYVGSTLRDLTWYWREALSAERQRELEEYVATKGDPEAWRNAFRSPEERSPLGPADFAATDAEEIARYLRDWEPGAGPASQTKTALAFELRRAVQAAPEKFSKGARAFADLPPLYVRRLFEGLQQSALNKASTDWSATLDLIESVLSSATSPAPGELSEGGDDPSSFWAAKEAIILLRTCLQRGEGIIGYEHADRLKSIICLVEKCAPAIPELPDFEERYVQNPYFGAEATMFGLAVELNVLFVYWASRHKESAVSADQSKALSSTPEFVGFAERALGYDAEKGRIARAVFGRYLSWLIHFGEEWVRQNFTLIFPSDRPLRDAAWLGYLLSDNRPARHFVQEMRPMYEDEIAEFKNENADESRFYRESRCAEYLTVLYLWGILPPDLHDLFLKSASNRLRKHVMWFIGRDLKSPNLPTDIRSRALAYWETRLAAGITATDKGKYRDELGIFGTWDGASAIDTEWLLTQQIKMFTAGYSPSNAFSVVEWAAKAAPDYPDQTVEMVAALFNIPKLDHWAYTATQSPVRAILTAGLGSSSADTHERVRRIVSFLASVGETSVLDLVNK